MNRQEMFLTKNVEAKQVGITPILVLTNKKDVEQATKISPELAYVSTLTDIEFVRSNRSPSSTWTPSTRHVNYHCCFVCTMEMSYFSAVTRNVQ